MQALQREIIGEMAAALGRAETLLDEALLRCELAGRHLDALEARKQRGEDVELELSRAFDEFEQTRTAAHRRRWELVVHREALGIRRHEPVLSELYPIPAERRPPG